MADDKPMIDPHTGTPTTGHVWDGLRELNTPLPRWWLWTFYATIIWAIGYWIVYPAIPLVSSHTAGLFGWSSRAAVADQVAALQAARGPLNEKLAATPVEQVEADPELLTFARAQGEAVFRTNCVQCHGAGGVGARGYPNLNDDEWIWGGKPQDIELTLQHGIRWTPDPETRASVMPAFGKDAILDAKAIESVAGYIMTFSGLTPPEGTDLALGKTVYAEQCAVCHGDDGKGNRDLGAPNLTDGIWLYGNDLATIVNRINVGGGGQMPAWGTRLTPAELRSVAVYVHSLGGGEPAN